LTQRPASASAPRPRRHPRDRSRAEAERPRRPVDQPRGDPPRTTAARVSLDATPGVGPVGFGSPAASHGRRWSRSFDARGEYRIYCSLHPADMSQYVRLR